MYFVTLLRDLTHSPLIDLFNERGFDLLTDEQVADETETVGEDLGES